MNAPITPHEVIDRFLADMTDIVGLHDGEIVDAFDAVCAAAPTPESKGQLLVALVVEEVRRRASTPGGGK